MDGPLLEVPAFALYPVLTVNKFGNCLVYQSVLRMLVRRVAV